MSESVRIILELWSYSMCSCRERCSLDWGSSVATVVPKDDLPRVRATHQQIRMETGKAHGHHRRLGKRTKDRIIKTR